MHPGQAEPLFLRALKIREKALGPDHPDTANSLDNLAGLYNYQGAYLIFRTRRKRGSAEKALGTDHPETALSLNNLAGLYYTQGAYNRRKTACLSLSLTRRCLTAPKFC
jgi:hypothetical protein